MNDGYCDHADLSGIEPERRDEVRRRLAALADYEAAPGRQHAERLARNLGLGTAQFYNLARAWKTLRDPLAIAGRSRPRKRRVDMENVQSAIIDSVMASAPDAMPEEIIRMSIDRATAEAVTMPAIEKMRRYVHAYRSQRLPRVLAVRGDLIVDHTVLEVPVENDRFVAQRPLATIVVDSQFSSIRALNLSIGSPSVPKIAGALMMACGAAIQGRAERRVRTIGIPHLADGRWPELRQCLERAGVTVAEYTPGAYGHGRCIEALLGLREKGIRLRSRLVEAGPARRAMTGRGPFNPVDLIEAERLVRARLGVEDASPSASFQPVSGDHARLLEDLKAIAGSLAAVEKGENHPVP